VSGRTRGNCKPVRGLSIAISPVATLNDGMKALFLVGVWLATALTLGAADELTLEEPPAKKPVAPKPVAKPPAAPATTAAWGT
jgi:hypothetical protein